MGQLSSYVNRTFDTQSMPVYLDLQIIDSDTQTDRQQIIAWVSDSDSMCSSWWCIPFTTSDQVRSCFMAQNPKRIEKSVPPVRFRIVFFLLLHCMHVRTEWADKNTLSVSTFSKMNRNLWDFLYYP